MIKDFYSQSTEYLFIPLEAHFEYQNPEYMANSSLAIRRANRTHLSMNVIFNYLQDVYEPEIHCEFKTFRNNEYKPTGIAFDLSLCDLMSDADLNVYKELMSDGIHGNIPECDDVMPKGNYWMKDVVVSSKIKKSIFLPGKWRTEFVVVDKNNVKIFAGATVIQIDEILSN
ncbi:uncharacterized protein LOC123291398 [Chrysoperla carnea]|uniref:uncharacterized protein LOC123291398 n=1 Tax=Chrysoperla carnea TaxID=189513 RepID=UPI001D07A63A|nr:uncharacterized protein LOC123291398 [Chrysoperla carnea]